MWAAQHDALGVAFQQIGDVGVSVTERAGGHRPDTDAQLVEERLDRVQDDHRRLREVRRLGRGADDVVGHDAARWRSACLAIAHLWVWVGPS